jgi:hypothetical protein
MNLTGTKLAVIVGKQFDTLGFDIDVKQITGLKAEPIVRTKHWPN